MIIAVGDHHDLMVNELNSNIVVIEFELLSRNYVYFRKA